MISRFKEPVPCLLCGAESDATAFVVRRDKYLVALGDPDPTTRYGVCRQCGLVYQNPRITSEVEAALYCDGDYRGFYGNPPQDFLDRHFSFCDQDVQWVLRAIGSTDGRGRKALEIGAGVGFGAAALKQRGWDAVGVEPEEELASVGRKHYGLDIRDEFFTESSFPGEHFNLFFTYNVFEHLLEPLAILKAARKKIDQDGFFYINVPTFRRCYGKLTWLQFGSPHTVMFTHQTLGNMLARAGFRVFKYEYHVDGALRMLAQPSDSTEELVSREDWRMVPLEIRYQGCKYFLARYVPSRIYQGLRRALSHSAGSEAALARLDGLKLRIKRRLGLHIWERSR